MEYIIGLIVLFLIFKGLTSSENMTGRKPVDSPSNRIRTAPKPPRSPMSSMSPRSRTKVTPGYQRSNHSHYLPRAGGMGLSFLGLYLYNQYRMQHHTLSEAEHQRLYEEQLHYQERLGWDHEDILSEQEIQSLIEQRIDQMVEMGLDRDEALAFVEELQVAAASGSYEEFESRMSEIEANFGQTSNDWDTDEFDHVHGDENKDESAVDSENDTDYEDDSDDDRFYDDDSDGDDYVGDDDNDTDYTSDDYESNDFDNGSSYDSNSLSDYSSDSNSGGWDSGSSGGSDSGGGFDF